MSYDVHVYAFESSPVPPATLARRVERDGWNVGVVDFGFPSSFRLSGNPKGLFGGASDSMSCEVFASFSPLLDDVARENLHAIADGMPARSRAHLRKCVAMYELSTAGVPDTEALAFVQRLAIHIACSVGGVCEDPQSGDVQAFAKDARLPKWTREPTANEVIGPLGVVVRDWASRLGYTIPPAFLRDRCQRYVFLITSFNPPKLNGRTFGFETEILPLLSAPPPGYSYRVFDFEEGVELARDEDWYKVVGPIPGLASKPATKGRPSAGD
jgi:hypothetical protein